MPYIFICVVIRDNVSSNKCGQSAQSGKRAQLSTDQSMRISLTNKTDDVAHNQTVWT